MNFKSIINLILIFIFLGCENLKNDTVKIDTLRIGVNDKIVVKKNNNTISEIIINGNDYSFNYSFYNNGRVCKFVEDNNINRRSVDYYNSENDFCIKSLQNSVPSNTSNIYIPLIDLKYDSCKTLNSQKSVYVQVKSETGKDTFYFGDNILYKINWNYPYSNKESPNYKSEVGKKIFINGFDNGFNIIDTSLINIFEVTGDSFRGTIKADRLGNNVLRGVLFAKHKLTEKSFQSFPLYFEYNYYVKKNVIDAYSREYFKFFDRHVK